MTSHFHAVVIERFNLPTDLHRPVMGRVGFFSAAVVLFSVGTSQRDDKPVEIESLKEPARQ
jgi:hypothetical protein